MITIDDRNEWLETDGRGGFASGTSSGIRTRRYHALLLSATTPPTGRVVLVNGLETFIETAAGTFALSSQRYAPDVIHPDGASHITSFRSEPWPTWDFDFPDGTRIMQETFIEHAEGATVVIWTLTNGQGVALRARPLMSGRDYHSMHHENGAFRFAAGGGEAAVSFAPYDGQPGVICLSNAGYHHGPEWYRQFLYREERARGLDSTEDLASPGSFAWRLDRPGAQAVFVLKAGAPDAYDPLTRADVLTFARLARERERCRRAMFRTPLDRAADGYLVARGSGRTIVAGYPWFTDWGRDTFIAMRGLCLATGRFEDARDILLEWASAVSEGMLPNRFPDYGELAEFNSVDASLWYVIAVHELLHTDQSRRAGPQLLTASQRTILRDAVLAIVSGYAAGTRYGIRMDGDGLLMAGVPGVQLTWMDARVGDRVITPRIGKPVEIEALWLNALSIAGAFDRRWTASFERGRRAFSDCFWNEERGWLADVVDVDGVAGTRDDTLRPNQILAVGGLPLALVEGARARRMVDAVEAELLTPLGLRSLGPREPMYAGHYHGDASVRDAAYHQGTVWPWLLGPFVEAWLRVRRNTKPARTEARRRFLDPLQLHLEQGGLGHVSEIADGNAPFEPKGCPFQAWSLGELLRIDRLVLRERTPAGSRRDDSTSKKTNARVLTI